MSLHVDPGPTLTNAERLTRAAAAADTAASLLGQLAHVDDMGGSDLLAQITAHAHVATALAAVVQVSHLKLGAK